MGSTALIGVFGAVVIVGIFGVLYYVSTLAKNVYAIKIQMKDDLAYEVERLQDFVEKEMAQRQKWIIRELAGSGDDKLARLQDDLNGLRAEVSRDVADLGDKMRKLAALQQALAAKQAQARPAAPPAMEPVFKAEGPGRKNVG